MLRIELTWTGTDATLEDALAMIDVALARVEEDSDVAADAADIAGVSAANEDAAIVLARVVIEGLHGRECGCGSDEGEEGDGRLTVNIYHGK